MDGLYFYIDYKGETISNFPNDLIPTIPECDNITSGICLCPERNIEMRHKKITNQYGYIYLRSYDKNITNKIFGHYFEALSLLFSAFVNQLQETRQTYVSDLHRLQHNVNTYNAKIRDDVDNLITIEEVRMNEWNKIVPYTENIIKENIRLAAVTLLRVIKNISLVNAEMNVYELLDNPERTLDLYDHPIHKVVKLSLQPFFMEFIDNNIFLNMGACYDKVYIDYSSISVIFGHIWSNAIKYCKKNSTIDITFETTIDSVIVRIAMTSLKINIDEIPHIYEEGYSGYWAKIINKHGKGIGMYYINKLIKMNKGTFNIVPGDEIKYYDGIPYANNVMFISLPIATE